MKVADINDMEMGNFIFGHSRGTYSVQPRAVYQEAFSRFLDSCGFDMYGAYYNGKRLLDEFENETFIIRTYYWGEDEKKKLLPNFEHKPTGLKIAWYKYPMRDAYSNQNVDIDEFKSILDDCASSMNG